jgi:3-isopropylmalate dehydrogenase
MTDKILLLSGDGIGPEIVSSAEKLLNALGSGFGYEFEARHGLLGGAAIDQFGDSFPEETCRLAEDSDAILLGAVGGRKWEKIERSIRPERGLLRLRAQLGLFCNLRPAVLLAALENASSLKADIVSGLDLMIIRELTGGIYFGQPRGIEIKDNGKRKGVNTLVYEEEEIERIVKLGFETAMKRSGRLCSVDKANVLEATELWRDVVDKMADDYPQVTVEHLYVDNAAMQLVRAPKQFDVIVTTNLFGDILSDLAAMLTGSIGMLPSASLDANNKGLFEPVHGSAPDIAGKNIANPIATIMSLSMMLKYSLNQPGLALKIDSAVDSVLDRGLRTADIAVVGEPSIGTIEMTDAIIGALS